MISFIFGVVVGVLLVVFKNKLLELKDKALDKVKSLNPFKAKEEPKV